MSETYFYHSFPRRDKENEEEALSRLASIADNGFLLVPEIIKWREPLQNGGLSEFIENCQKRICFTELAPNELSGHTKQFGRFSIEYRIDDLRKLGAVPVFYIPKDDSYEYLGGIGGALIARLAEIQELLKRLGDLKRFCEECNTKNDFLTLTRNGKPVGTIKCTVGSAEELIPYFTLGSQKPEVLESTIKGLSSYFYPTEDLKYNSPLHYYRQREWRITANIAKDGKSVDRDLFSEEKEKLLKIDKSFFGKELSFRTGIYRRVDRCKYLTALEGKHVLEFANRVIVPQESVTKAQLIVDNKGFRLEVAPLEKVSSV